MFHTVLPAFDECQNCGQFILTFPQIRICHKSEMTQKQKRVYQTGILFLFLKKKIKKMIILNCQSQEMIYFKVFFKLFF